MVKSRQRSSEDSEMEDVSKTKKRATSEDVEEEDGSVAAGDEEEDEEEYEIEAIINHEMNTFKDGQIGYLVRWKGYDESHDSWVKEEDAANAKELIETYWSKRGTQKPTVKKAPRKSETKSSVSSSQKRKSPVNMADDSDEESVPKKRGRPPRASASDDDEPMNGSKPAKKGRKSTGTKKSASVKQMPASDEDDLEAEPLYASMKKWKDSPSWDHLVHHIETVERSRDGRLMVYFMLKSQNGKDGALCVEESTLCKEKMPKKMLDFYEENLRWKQSD